MICAISSESISFPWLVSSYVGRCAERVHVSEAYRKMDMTRECISLIFELTYIQTYEHTNIQTYKFTYIQTCKHANMQIRKNTNIPTYTCSIIIRLFLITELKYERNVSLLFLCCLSLRQTPTAIQTPVSFIYINKMPRSVSGRIVGQ